MNCLRIAIPASGKPKSGGGQLPVGGSTARTLSSEGGDGWHHRRHRAGGSEANCVMSGGDAVAIPAWRLALMEHRPRRAGNSCAVARRAENDDTVITESELTTALRNGLCCVRTCVRQFNCSLLAFMDAFLARAHEESSDSGNVPRRQRRRLRPPANRPSNRPTCGPAGGFLSTPTCALPCRTAQSLACPPSTRRRSFTVMAPKRESQDHGAGRRMTNIMADPVAVPKPGYGDEVRDR